MNTSLTKLSRKISVGVMAAGFATLSLTTALPASAATNSEVTGQGATQAQAQNDARKNCLARGGSTVSLGDAEQNADGSWTATVLCVLP